MAKQLWKPGNMLYPLPVVMVSLRGKDGQNNIITIGWTGTICSDPAMVSISVRPERYSHRMLLDTGEFVINLTTEELVKAAAAKTETAVVIIGLAYILSRSIGKYLGANISSRMTGCESNIVKYEIIPAIINAPIEG